MQCLGGRLIRDMAGYAYRDHPSDVRIRAWGASVEETFAQVSLGMWAMVADPSGLPVDREWTVSAGGESLEELLVSFLNEQILMFDVKGLVAGNVERLRVTEDGAGFAITAVFSGCGRDLLSRPPERYLKAATFHNLMVSPELVEVTLDV